MTCVNTVCTPSFTGGVGQTCTSPNGKLQCKPGLICDYTVQPPYVCNKPYTPNIGNSDYFYINNYGASCDVTDDCYDDFGITDDFYTCNCNKSLSYATCVAVAYTKQLTTAYSALRNCLQIAGCNQATNPFPKNCFWNNCLKQYNTYNNLVVNDLLYADVGCSNYNPNSNEGVSIGIGVGFGIGILILVILIIVLIVLIRKGVIKYRPFYGDDHTDSVYATTSDATAQPAQT